MRPGTGSRVIALLFALGCSGGETPADSPSLVGTSGSERVPESVVDADPPSEGASAAPSDDAPGPNDDDALAGRIVQGISVDHDGVRITRDALLALLGDSRGVLRFGRFVPIHGAPEDTGFRIYGVRLGSPFAALGLVNGDLIRSVNDQVLSSSDAGRAAARSLAEADTLAILLVRRGEPFVLRVRVVPARIP